jgi:hypothetical protein
VPITFVLDRTRADRPFVNVVWEVLPYLGTLAQRFGLDLHPLTAIDDPYGADTAIDAALVPRIRTQLEELLRHLSAYEDEAELGLPIQIGNSHSPSQEFHLADLRATLDGLIGLLARAERDGRAVRAVPD